MTNPYRFPANPSPLTPFISSLRSGLVAGAVFQQYVQRYEGVVESLSGELRDMFPKVMISLTFRTAGGPSEHRLGETFEIKIQSTSTYNATIESQTIAVVDILFDGSFVVVEARAASEAFPLPGWFDSDPPRGDNVEAFKGFLCRLMEHPRIALTIHKHLVRGGFKGG